MSRIDRKRSRRKPTIQDLLDEDAQHNLGVETGRRHILILRHLEAVHWRYNDHFLAWVRQHHPRAARRIRLERLPAEPAQLDQTALLVPWLQDPLKERFQAEYRQALRWETQCRQLNIPIVNPVEKLSHSIKSHALAVFARCGLRAIKTAALTNPATFRPEDHGLFYPICIRENIIHSRPLVLVHDHREWRQVDWNAFSHPLAVEFVDTRSPDGYYRKYRCFLAGSACLPRHLLITNNWVAHARDRVITAANRREELQYMQLPEDRNRVTFHRLSEALGFDTVAFDYSYDRDHQLVVWEPNPLPVLWKPPKTGDEQHLAYHLPTLDRLYRALLEFYLERAGLNELLS